MESLYRKYRPLTFESVVGQQHIVSTLEHAVREGRLSHAYLFCGPRGTGKTTMARILAKSLLCQGSEAARAEGASGCMPDGTCPECEAIAAGTHPDVYELDAASRTGVDSIREEIVNSVSFAPVRGAYKVYIIDEVHMLTTAAFNALLKTLEEPPSHVVFVLCTTDPQKILETILSRCQRFDFHRISNEDIVGRMRYICEQEGFEYSDEALDLVARHARGGMRDALSTLEQLSVFGAGAVRAEDARALLGEVSSSVLAEFARGLAGRDMVGLLAQVREQVEAGNDLMDFTRDLIAHVRDVYTVCVAGTRSGLVDATPEEMQALAAEAELFEGPDRLAQVLTVLDDAALEMRTASDVRLVLEMACTRLSRPEASLSIEALAERVSRLEAQLAAGVASAPMSPAALTGGAAPAAPATPAPSAPAAPTGAAPTSDSAGAPLPWQSGAQAPARPQRPAAPAAQSPRPVRPAAPAPAPSRPQDPAARVAAAAAAGVPAPGTPEPPRAEAELQRRWEDVYRRLQQRDPRRAGLLSSARPQSDDGSNLVVWLPPRSDFAFKMLQRDDSRNVVEPLVSAVFGPRTIEYAMAQPAGASARAAEPADAVHAVTVSAPAPAPATPAPAPAPAPAARPVASGQKRSLAPKPVDFHAPKPKGPVTPQAAAAQAHSPSTPATSAASASPQVDQASGPTMVGERDIEADRRAWENEQVPYDDAMIASYDDGAGAAPVDLPAAAPAAQAAPAAGAELPPWATHEGVTEQSPQTEAEAKDLLGSVFGEGIVFKPVEDAPAGTSQA